MEGGSSSYSSIPVVFSLSSQKKDIQELMINQRAMAAKQEDMSVDLKAIITILSQK
ncbi:hypothetical protein A2U01_0083688 [Trifolium medium]|uniref:Uncharacterized protein n=1 Tax=Trifolium medium TaxID=97028 RepID=A0A392TMM8_9FABA|nr:hypothetical protein [Trifolium medium]